MHAAALRERVHLSTAVVAVVCVAVIVAAVLVTDDGVPPAWIVFAAGASVYLFARSLVAVRQHDYYPLAQVVVLTTLMGLWWASYEEFALFPGVLVAVGVVGIVVELYNHRNGTSYLRIEGWRES